MVWKPVDTETPVAWAESGDFANAPLARRLANNFNYLLINQRPIINKWWSLGWSSDTDPNDDDGEAPGTSSVVPNLIGNFGPTVTGGEFKSAMQFNGTGLQFSTPRNSPMTIPVPIPAVWRPGRKLYVTVAGRVTGPAGTGFHAWARFGTSKETTSSPAYRIDPGDYPNIVWDNDTGDAPPARGEATQYLSVGDLATAGVEDVVYWTFEINTSARDDGPTIATTGQLYVFVTFLADGVGDVLESVDVADCLLADRATLDVQVPPATLLPDQPFGPFSAELTLPRATSVGESGLFLPATPTQHFVTTYTQGFVAGSGEAFDGGNSRFFFWPPISGSQRTVGASAVFGPMGFSLYGVEPDSVVEIRPLPTMLVYSISVHQEKL